MLKLLVAFLIVLFLQSALCKIVKTADGKIEGTILQTRLGNEFFAFRKIPYAQPPIGELRFRAPLPVEPWHNVLDCTAYGPVCWQTNRLPASEDCLHLNVFTHNLPTNEYSNLQPVIVFLHSGGLVSGTPIDYGPEYLLDRDIVYVTVNYRLGAFGFLALETPDIPGNAGFKDQYLALKWVQKNIRRFGGDPQRVTLGSITSASYGVVAHMVSPMSKGLFSNVILMSGAMNFNEKVRTNNFDLAGQVAETLNCSSSGFSEIAECLQNAPAVDLAVASFTPFFKCAVQFWRAVVEPNFGQRRFLTDQPETLLRKGKFDRVNILTGTSDELFSSAFNILNDGNATQYLNEHFDELAPVCFAFERTKDLSEKQISRRIREFYFPFDTIDIRSRSNLHLLFTESNICHRVHRLVHLTSHLTNVFYYKVTFVGRFSRLPFPRSLPYGVAHGDDLQYIFYPNIVGPNKILPSDPENIMVERLTRIWENFAATGNPNDPTDEFLGEMVWPPHDAEKELYLDIGTHLIEKNGKDLRVMAFWDDIFGS